MITFEQYVIRYYFCDYCVNYHGGNIVQGRFDKLYAKEIRLIAVLSGNLKGGIPKTGFLLMMGGREHSISLGSLPLPPPPLLVLTLSSAVHVERAMPPPNSRIAD